jgi:hypothetical protein
MTEICVRFVEAGTGLQFFVFFFLFFLDMSSCYALIAHVFALVPSLVVASK